LSIWSVVHGEVCQIKVLKWIILGIKMCSGRLLSDVKVLMIWNDLCVYELLSLLMIYIYNLEFSKLFIVSRLVSVIWLWSWRIIWIVKFKWLCCSQNTGTGEFSAHLHRIIDCVCGSDYKQAKYLIKNHSQITSWFRGRRGLKKSFHRCCLLTDRFRGISSFYCLN